jgi:hypothetical protein
MLFRPLVQDWEHCKSFPVFENVPQEGVHKKGFVTRVVREVHEPAPDRFFNGGQWKKKFARSSIESLRRKDGTKGEAN